jgi:hypothetical protein
MTNIEIIALAKAISEDTKKDASKSLKADDYVGAFLARISYSLTKGNPYKQNIVAKAEPWKLLAVALSKLNGVTVQALVTEANSGEIDSEEIKKQADAAMAEIKGKTETTCNGKITGEVAVDIIPTSEVKVM